MNLAPFFPSSCDPTKPPALRYSPHESKPTTFCSPGLRNCHAAHGTSSYRTAHLAPAGGADHDDARCVARDHPGRDVLVDRHLGAFTVDGRRYGMPDDDGFGDGTPEARAEALLDSPRSEKRSVGEGGGSTGRTRG